MEQDPSSVATKCGVAAQVWVQTGQMFCYRFPGKG